jgi:hypothetical protein
MSVIYGSKIDVPAAWKGKDIKDDNSWIYNWSDEQIAILEKGLAAVKEKGLTCPNFTKNDFPIAELADAINHFNTELEDGKGFILIRGLPIERYSDDEAAIIYYGLGLHMGTPVSQNIKGDMLGHVRDVGAADPKSVRVYETSEYLPYHADMSDVVGLLSLRKAKAGGLSSISSAMTLFNEIFENHKEYLGLLHRHFLMEHINNGSAGPTPIFSYHKGKLSAMHLRQYIEIAQNKAGLPLSPVEVEAFDLVDSILNDPDIRLDMMMEPGDIQFCNNYTIFHSRTGFEDYPEPERKRHLYRLWLKMPNARECADDFPGKDGIAKRD